MVESKSVRIPRVITGSSFQTVINTGTTATGIKGLTGSIVAADKTVQQMLKPALFNESFRQARWSQSEAMKAIGSFKLSIAPETIKAMNDLASGFSNQWSKLAESLSHVFKDFDKHFYPSNLQGIAWLGPFEQSSSYAIAN